MVSAFIQHILNKYSLSTYTCAQHFPKYWNHTDELNKLPTLVELKF